MSFQCSHCLGLGYMVYNSNFDDDLSLENIEDLENDTDEKICPICKGAGYVDDLDLDNLTNNE